VFTESLYWNGKGKINLNMSGNSRIKFKKKLKSLIIWPTPIGLIREKKKTEKSHAGVSMQVYLF
jgi:hypothetical protein